MDFKENLLHFIWQYKLFESRHLQCTDGSSITIKHVGNFTQSAGPDFSEAQIIIDGQLWVGSVEIHKKASEWYEHQHHLDHAYNNVILHVVWEDDQVIFDGNNVPLSTLVLKPYVSKILLEKYHQLMQDKTWIYCENQLNELPQIIKTQTLESVFIERLAHKIQPFEEQLSLLNGDWEQLLFMFLLKAFGLNINGEAFFDIGKNIAFEWFKKERHQLLHLEALLFGQTQLIHQTHEDLYFRQLKEAYAFLNSKYKWDIPQIQINFFKLRPDNFPTIRLSQLANLYHQEPHVFEKLIKNDLFETKKFLKKIKVSDYWQTHYIFDKSVPKRNHYLSENFIDLLLINVVLPVKYLYFQHLGKDLSEDIINFYSDIKKEKNSVVDKFESFGMTINHAMDSQAVVHLKKHYCEKRLCLHCVIGKSLMGKTTSPI